MRSELELELELECECECERERASHVWRIVLLSMAGYAGYAVRSRVLIRISDSSYPPCLDLCVSGVSGCTITWTFLDFLPWLQY